MTIKETELEELRESEARSRIVVETVADAIITIDEASVIRFVNPAAARVFGYPAEEMVGAHLTMLMPEYLRHLHEAGMARYVETGHKHIPWEGVELPGLHKSGREVPLEVSFGEFSLGDKRYFTGIARDITERKRAARRLAAQYEVTRTLAESASFAEAGPRILRTVCEGLGWEKGALWSVERGEGSVLRHVAEWHAPTLEIEGTEVLGGRLTFEMSEGLLGKVWETGEPVWVEDMMTSSYPRAAAAGRAGLHGGFAFPILLHGEVLGVFEFFNREVRPPDAALLAMMASIGSQTGQVIERQRAEDERARLSEEIIRVQDEQLAELSTPLIPLTDQIVVMPLVGTVDSKRAQRMTEALLSGLSETRPPIAIIDITGVSFVDAHVANTLVRMAQAARLLGTHVVLTGIRGGVARSLVGLGIELGGLTMRKTLQDGIACSLEFLRVRATKL
ncbi:MAG: PAS domain S-box protein [Acidobacteria bacterium]|nr:PAS domain S-box protein [Acidobacteriota bacterium]